MERIKKSRKEIADLIISSLEKKPLSTQQLSEKIKSNWSTINEILEELKHEGKIREIISTGKISIYRLADYPVFYGLPIQKKHRDLASFLFSEICKAWQARYKSLPPATIVQKIAVDVSKEYNLDIPLLPFHYGLVMPIFAGKSQNVLSIPNSKEIISAINSTLPTHSEKAWKEEINQYKKYNMKFFLAKSKLCLEWNNKDNKKIESAILNLASEFPNNEENANIFGLFDKFVYCAVILLNWKNYDSDTIELKELFEKIWDLTTSNMFFNETKKYILKEDMQLFEIIRISVINSKISSAEEILSEIEPIVNSINPEEIEAPMDEESIKIREILTENADYE